MQYGIPISKLIIKIQKYKLGFLLWKKENIAWLSMHGILILVQFEVSKTSKCFKIVKFLKF